MPKPRVSGGAVSGPPDSSHLGQTLSAPEPPSSTSQLTRTIALSVDAISTEEHTVLGTAVMLAVAPAMILTTVTPPTLKALQDDGSDPRDRGLSEGRRERQGAGVRALVNRAAGMVAAAFLPTVIGDVVPTPWDVSHAALIAAGGAVLLALSLQVLLGPRGRPAPPDARRRPRSPSQGSSGRSPSQFR